MKLFRNSLSFFVLGFSLSVFGQNPQDLLVRINDSVYNVADFEQLYNRNIDIITDESQKNIADYFERYKTFKVKIQDAYALGLDQTEAFQSEFQTHRRNLAEKYFVDEAKLNSMVDEALTRSDFELNASHILFTVNEFSAPADTLKAYNKAIEVRKEILNGRSFESAAHEYSEDPSAKVNKGNLGYFSVLKMVYPYENAAYNTEVGTVSEPVRSSFGYHLIKVNNKREVQDNKTIAHIFVKTNDENQEEAKRKIHLAYARLKLGEPFEEVVLHFSDDESNREEGGLIGVYETGNLKIDGIDEVVYELDEKRSYSRPFLSQHGWHIVMVTDIQERKNKEELRPHFVRRVQSDQRAKILENEIVEHLKLRYEFTENHQNISELAGLLQNNNSIENSEEQLVDKTAIALAFYGDEVILAKDVLEFIYSSPQNFAGLKTREEIAAKAYIDYTKQRLKSKYDRDLEKNFPDFALTMKDYKEGMLLFEWLNHNFWEPSAKDSLSQKKFYRENRVNYTDKGYFIGEVYVFKKRYDAKLYRKLLDSKYQLEEKEFPIVYKYQGLFYLDDKRLPTSVDLNTIEEAIIKHNKHYYIFLVRDKRFEQISEYEDVKNKVLSDYQMELEEKYTEKLMKAADIEVNTMVLEQLKSKYNNENLN